MNVNKVKILGKVENLVCRILRVLSTENLNWIDVHDKRGKCLRIFIQTGTRLGRVSEYIEHDQEECYTYGSRSRCRCPL